MNNFLAVLKASFQRDLQNYMSYRFNIFGELFFNFFIVFMIFYLAKVFETSESEFLTRYNNNYFVFLLTGLMLFLFLTRLFSTILIFITSAQNLGYFESFFNTRTSIETIIISSSVFPMIQSSLRIIIIYIFCNIFAPGALNLMNLLDIMLILLFSSLPFIGIALCAGSLIVVFKRASFVSSIFLLGCAIFSGVFYPINVLPEYLQKLSLIFPSSFSLEIIRGRVLENFSYTNFYWDLILIGILSVFYIFLGLKVLKLAINKAKREGSIGHF
tara:strand:+ start:5933 stop:6748 length:816 start_codon:yes stop_codon:yes gene_type:complete